MKSRSIRLFWSLCIVSQLLPATIFASSSGGYGGNSLMGGFGGSGSYGSSGGGGGYGGGGQKGPVTAAVETHRSVEVKPVQMNNEPHEPHVVEVPGDDSPIVVHFKSQSSRVLVQQTHTPAQIGEPEHTSSEDEPQRVIHEVVKPVIQEIREVIQPYRRLIQQIQPVLETTHTIIAKGGPRPDVQPVGVDGSSSGSLGGGSGGSGKSYGGSSGGGNYAAAASTATVSLKSAPTNSQSARSPTSTSSVSGPAPSHHHQANGNNVRKQLSSEQIQQIFQQAQPNSAYSARRGDLREPTQPTQTRISLRPAPVGYNSYYRQPVVQAVQPVIQAIQPNYGYSEYQGAVSAFHEEDLPMMTFVAKPARFRARARA